MRVASTAAFVCMLLLGAACDRWPLGGFRDSFTNISGVVLADDGAPVGGVQVTLESDGLIVSPETVMTNAAGEFRFARVSRTGPRTLKATLTKQGYEARNMLLKTNRKERLRVVLTGGNAAPTLKSAAPEVR